MQSMIELLSDSNNNNDENSLGFNQRLPSYEVSNHPLNNHTDNKTFNAVRSDLGLNSV